MGLGIRDSMLTRAGRFTASSAARGFATTTRLRFRNDAGGTNMSSSAASEIARLREEIRHHDRKYHIEAAPEISDTQYDRLVERSRSSKPNIRNWSRPTAPRSASATSRSRASRRSSIACRCSRSTTPTASTN